MNAHPRLAPQPGATPATRTAAFVTATYAPDFERCRLLCETLDAHVEGANRHYLLVEGRDVALFRRLETQNRVVVDERDLLPAWLRPVGDPTSFWRRRVWLSTRVRPLRGWHVQQLRRIALAAHVAEEVLVYCDSDVAFLKPFDAASLWRGDRLRLLRRDGELKKPGFADQRLWSANAGRALGLGAISEHDYIATLIAWRRADVVAMCERMQAVSGRHWIEAAAARRHFSECMLYGRFVDDVSGGAGHFHDSTELCRVYWDGPAPDDRAFRTFVEAMSPEQVAIGMQSFIGTDIGRIRRLIGA